MIMTAQPSVTIPLPQVAHHLATQFAAAQQNPQKGTQVYLNTLAIYAVHTYLKWFQIESDLTQSESWHPVVRSLTNRTDLYIPGYGTVECCPLLLNASEFLIFPDVLGERKGYIAVQCTEQLHEVKLLGFMNAGEVAADSERIRVAALHPIEEFLDSLNALVLSVAEEQSDRHFVHLTHWLQQTFDNGWQALDQLLASDMGLSFARGKSFKPSDSRNENSAKGAKLLDLGLTLGSQSVMLLVAIAPDTTRGFSILVQLHPSRGQDLPAHIKLILLSESGMVLQDIQARSQDNYIQMRQFWGQAGETFSIQVSLDTVTLTEHFTL
jgi:Protein of unknown function (DUF1822)